MCDKRYYCCVPHCTTTSRNSKKLFFTVPSDTKRRILWLKAMQRNVKDLSMKTTLRVCEDHFDLEHDMKNYIKFKYYPDTQRKQKILRKDVVPHIFRCQPDKAQVVSGGSGTKFSKKMQRQKLIEGTLDLCESKNEFDEGIETETAAHVSLLCSNQLEQFGEGLIQQDEYVSDSSQSDQSTTSSHEERKKVVEVTLLLAKKKPEIYLGIPKQCTSLIPSLIEAISCSEIDIHIVMQKIKRNLSFLELGDLYGLSEGCIARRFKKIVVEMKLYLENFIVWPSPENIVEMMPILFRKNYMKVESIIDCFEIGIDKPKDPNLQSTWSECKKSNTMKYLISSTPNGTINFISKGFGGGITDTSIVEESGYLNLLRPGSWVMADRGFKGIDALLEPLTVQFKRPPSLTSGENVTKTEILEIKRIACLRIHIERIINRIREFKILGLDSGIHPSLVKYLDMVVIVAVGLVNIQESLTEQ